MSWSQRSTSGKPMPLRALISAVAMFCLAQAMMSGSLSNDFISSMVIKQGRSLEPEKRLVKGGCHEPPQPPLLPSLRGHPLGYTPRELPTGFPPRSRPVHFVEEYQDRCFCQRVCGKEAQEVRAGRRQLGGVGGVYHELGKGRSAGPSVTETAPAQSPLASQAGLGKSKMTLKQRALGTGRRKGAQE